MTPTLVPFTLNTTDSPSSQGGICPVAVSTTFDARNGKFARAMCSLRRSMP